MYTCLVPELTIVSWHKQVWNGVNTPRISFFYWLVVLQRLPTLDRLARFGLLSTIVCNLCNSGPESHNHLFCTCPFAVSLIDCIMSALGVRQRCSSISQWIALFAQSSLQDSSIFKIRADALGCVFNAIWQGRNNLCS